ncbi:hypothetical protein KC19_2G097200 [Ceratodon purpureus]|uniref:Uncharacterized protein n=1 Tax=Ceratodon purpureus TaxID=3225 RepID=A0A8T0IV13_CERPU|nr:hypothetical protein KC19_2G096800 [Ceratodon purpureus]KAG0586518.1 hypothetical protein KC19_2G097200 [Ceratodon purpureus]
MWEWIFGRIRRGEDSFSLAWVMMACFSEDGIFSFWVAVKLETGLRLRNWP